MAVRQPDARAKRRMFAAPGAHESATGRVLWAVTAGWIAAVGLHALWDDSLAASKRGPRLRGTGPCAPRADIRGGGQECRKGMTDRFDLSLGE
jgi:hypothetical protein